MVDRALRHIAELDKDERARTVQRAMFNSKMHTVCQNPSLVCEDTTLFERNLVDEDAACPDQQNTGLCWMYAGVGLLQHMAKAHYGSSVKLSVAYLVLFDKLCRACATMDEIHRLRSKDLSSRTAARVLRPDMMADGGTWNVFQALVEKHGAVPEVEMPLGENLKNTSHMNSMLRQVIIRYVPRLRDESEYERAKRECEEEVARVLHACIGLPPTRFTLKLRTDKGKLISEDTDPIAFARSFARGTTTIANVPSYATWTVHIVRGQQYVEGVKDQGTINVDPERFAATVRRQLDRQVPVWFTCDMSGPRVMNASINVLSNDALAIERTLGISAPMGKEERVSLRLSAPDHAMLLVGYDTDSSGEVRVWKAQNSWGAKSGAAAGFVTIDASWLLEHAYSAAIVDAFVDVDREGLPVETHPPWDAIFGAVASTGSRRSQIYATF